MLCHHATQLTEWEQINHVAWFFSNVVLFVFKEISLCWKKKLMLIGDMEDVD